MSRVTSIAFIVLCLLVNTARAQDQPTEEQTKAMEIYGFIMLDGGYNFRSIDPNWFDVIRPTKLPAFDKEFGPDGNTYMSVRQTRFGVKNYFPTCLGELKTQFEWEMFGTGVDAGQTTIRLRHAYAEIGHFGFGQYWSPFMDIDVFPNTVEYWGPPGMAFFRNVQIRYMPIMGDTRLTFALERPGASADQGVYADRVELKGVKPRFPLPDLSAEYRYGAKWGYLELAGIVRSIQWVDQNAGATDLSGHAVGYGGSFSTNIKFGPKKRTVFRGQAIWGKGIQNYMNDAPVDVGVQNNFSDPHKPVIGVALPMWSMTAFMDIQWSDKFSSSIGYSMIDITNSDGQTMDAFREGKYAVANIMYYPAEHLMACLEGQWGNRENYGDGWSYDIWKVQLTFKANFSHTFYRKKS